MECSLLRLEEGKEYSIQTNSYSPQLYEIEVNESNWIILIR